MNKISEFLRDYIYELISTVTLMVYFSPFFIDPDSARYLIHDLLNDKVVYFKNLVESGLLFGGNDAVYEYSMGGFPRAYLLTEFSVFKWLYYIFDARWAVNVNYMLIHTIGFLGMRLLLKRYVTTQKEIFNLSALAFAMLPTLPYLGIGVLGIPLLIYSFLNIINRNAHISDYLVVFFFPFYSMFAITNMYTFPLMGIVFLLGCIKGIWRFDFRSVFPFILLAASTLLVEYRLILIALSGVPNNRMVYYPDYSAFLNWKGIIGGSVKAFFLGHYHFHSLSLFSAVISLVALCWMLLTGHRSRRMISGLLAFTALLAVGNIFLNNYNLKAIFGDKYPFIDYRFWLLFPALWYAIFAYAAVFIFEKAGKMVALAVLAANVLFVMFLLYPKDFRGSRYADNVFANTYIHPQNQEQATFDEFYKPEVFRDIVNKVPDIKSARVACIGVIPEVAQFNGLKTIDGYYSLYPARNWYFNKMVDSLERMKTSFNARHYTNTNNLYIADMKLTKAPEWNYALLKSKDVRYLISNRKIDTGDVLLTSYRGTLFVYSIR